MRARDGKTRTPHIFVRYPRHAAMLNIRPAKLTVTYFSWLVLHEGIYE
ncbi:MAG: hypothetical protein AzoDbin1_01836 [Azoarcus sp.]|nr:hypothetical protein [Azoarcus sp.]